MELTEKSVEKIGGAVEANAIRDARRRLAVDLRRYAARLKLARLKRNREEVIVERKLALQRLESQRDEMLRMGRLGYTKPQQVDAAISFLRGSTIEEIAEEQGVDFWLAQKRCTRGYALLNQRDLAMAKRKPPTAPTLESVMLTTTIEDARAVLEDGLKNLR